MSGRHRRAKWGSERVGVSKSERAASHRNSRHRANTEMHLATIVDDTENLENLVFTEPRHSGQNIPVEQQSSPLTGSNKLRHWKQPFWKRRNAVAHQRAEAMRQAAT